MPVLMIRCQVTEDGIAEVGRAVEAAFAALNAQQPKGVRFAYYRRPDSAEFVGLLELDEGIENPLPGIGAARNLQSIVAKWVVGNAPTPQPLERLGSYGFR